ncbi:MAG: aminoacyl-tRNA hydrolase [Candidatus Eisenbacteria bacterium]|nr:aminoacyl-tRNA hydrolase [Candidatus Eisenbacteria bacterium]
MEDRSLDPPGPALRMVVGLGNPGERYARTRHNAGFLALERLGRLAGARWLASADSEEASVRLEGRPVLLLRPLTYMNRSGRAVAAALASHAVAPDEMLVVVDDVYLPFGRLRIRERGGAGGHNLSLIHI